MGKEIKINFYQVVTSVYFYACILFVTLLCLCSGIYDGKGYGGKYSAIEVLLYFDREEILSDVQLCSFHVMQQGAGSWLSLFIPLLSAFCFLPILCDAHDSQFARFAVFAATNILRCVFRFS